MFHHVVYTYATWPIVCRHLNITSEYMKLLKILFQNHGYKYKVPHSFFQEGFPQNLGTWLLEFSLIWVQKHQWGRALMLGNKTRLLVGFPIHQNGTEWFEVRSQQRPVLPQQALKRLYVLPHFTRTSKSSSAEQSRKHWAYSKNGFVAIFPSFYPNQEYYQQYLGRDRILLGCVFLS